MRYQEVKYQIEKMVSLMHADEPLPSRDALCKMLTTTRATLHKAIQELVQDGKLYTRGGSGTYVVGNSQRGGGSIRFVGVVVPNNKGDGYRMMVSGAEEYLREHGINLILSCTDGDVDKQDECITRLFQSGIQGLILAPAYCMDITRDYVLYSRLQQHRMPVVCCYRGLEGVLQVPIVGYNDFYTGYKATKHLISRGYRNITYIAQFILRTTLDRYQGYVAAMVEEGLQITRDNIVFSVAKGTSTPEAYQETLAVLHQDPKIDGIFCNSDTIINGIYKAIHDCGKRVSDDIGVISLDNFEKECLLLEPKLSSIGGQSEEIGRRAAQILLSAMNDTPTNVPLFVTTTILFDRESCLGPKR